MPLDPDGEWHGTTGYPPEFRRKVLDLVEADRSVADIARDLEISDQSISTWRRHDRIDHGLHDPAVIASSRPPPAIPTGQDHGPMLRQA